MDPLAESVRIYMLARIGLTPPCPTGGGGNAPLFFDSLQLFYFFIFLSDIS
jgi:hypothetical protein